MSKPEATKPKTEAELQREREIREERERKAREAREARERELQEALNRKNAEAQRIAAEKQNANTEVSKITTQGANGSYVERDDKGRVTETKNENGEVRGFKYNAKGEVNGYTDENGKLWTSEDGKNWKSEGEKERVMRVQVNPQDGSVGIVESTKKETTMLNVKLDDNKRLQSGTDANGVTRTFGYDKNGNINSFTDESGKQWTSEDGKVFQSENEKRAFVVETNASAGTFSITEPAKLTIRYTDGKQHERTVGGLMLKDKNGKILETRSSDDAKPTTFTYDSNTNKLKTITNPAGETFTSEDGSTFTSPSGNTMRNPSITQDGRMTYVAKNGDVMQMKLQDKEPQVIITRDALKVKARNIAYAMNGGIDWGVTSSTIESELKTMDAPAREELKRVWKEMHAAGETNFQFADMNAEFSDEFKGSNLIKFNSMLDRKSEKEDVPANVDMALTAITNRDGDFDKQTNEMRIRTLIGNKNSKQIAEIDEEYKSKHDGVSILTAVQENPNVSQATKDAMVILMKGQDKRTDEDTVTLANLALKSGNMAMLRETMRSSSQNARKILSEDPELVTKINEAFPLLDQDGKASHDPNNKTRVETSNGQIAKDLLLTGRVSTETEIALNTSAGGDNETAVIAALDNMPEADRLSYQRGKELVANGATVETVSGADLEAVKKYNNIQTAMKNAGWDYETRRWESHINNSKPVAAFIDELYNHRGSMLTYNSSVQDIAKSVENMPKEVWERLRKENLEGRHELKDQILAAFKDYNFNFNNEAKVKELSDILDKKVAAENFEDSKVNGRRDIFTALDNTWGFDNDETSGLEALRHMTPAEQESYKNGKEVKDESTLNAADLEKYRADKEFANKLDAKLLEVFGTGIFDDAEYDAANKILDGVIAGRKGDDVLNDLIIYSQETSVEEADVIRKVQEAFRKNPELAQRIQNPQSEADKAYAEEFKTSMAKALGDKWYNSLMFGALGNDYDLFGKQLVEQGKLDFNRAQMLNVGIFDDDEYGVNKSILYADQKETERLLNDKAYQDKVFCFMSEDQRAVALNNLKERNRQQAEIAKTEQQLSQVADTKEGQIQKGQLEKKLELQKLQLDKLFAGEMRPEDKLRAAILGCGTDEAAIKEVFAKIRPDQRAQLLKDYAAKYGSLPSDLEGDIGGQDLANAMRNLRPEGITQDEDLIYALDEYSNSVSGIGTQFIRGYDGTADQMDQRFGDLESEIANANRLGIEVPAEIRQQQMEVLSKSIDNLVESKEALGNTIADIAITVVAIGGVCLGQPESLGLLAFTSFATALGLTGAALKVAIKQVIMGNNYTSEMMYMDMATGFTDGALNVIGPGQVAALTTIGKKTATRSAAKITEKLMEKGILRNVATSAVEETAEKALMSSSKLVNVALEEGASQADKRVLQEVNRIVRTAMTNGSEKLDDAAIKRAALNLVDEQVGKRAYQEALKTGTETVAKQASKDAMDTAADEIAVVMKNTLIDEVKLSQNKLKNYIVDATFNGAGAALAGGTSGTLYAGANFDSSKSLSENLEMMAKAGLMSAAIGGVTGGGMTLGMRSVMDKVSSKISKNAANDLNFAVNTDELTAEAIRNGELTISNRSAGSGNSSIALEGTVKTSNGTKDVVVDLMNGTEGQRRLRFEQQAKRIDEALGFNNMPITESRTGLVNGKEVQVRVQEKRGTQILDELPNLMDAKARELGRNKITMKEYFDLEPEFKLQLEQTLIERIIVGDSDMHLKNLTIDYVNGKPRFNNIDLDKSFTTFSHPMIPSDYAYTNKLINVFKDQPLSESSIVKLRAFVKEFDTVEGRVRLFDQSMHPDQIDAVMSRSRWMADNGKLPKSSSMEEMAFFGKHEEFKQKWSNLSEESYLKAKNEQSLYRETERKFVEREQRFNQTYSNNNSVNSLTKINKQIDQAQLEGTRNLLAKQANELANGEIKVVRPVLEQRVQDLQELVTFNRKMTLNEDIKVVLSTDLGRSGIIFKNNEIHVYPGTLTSKPDTALLQLRRALEIADADKRIKQIEAKEFIDRERIVLLNAKENEIQDRISFIMDEIGTSENLQDILGKNVDASRWQEMIAKAQDLDSYGTWNQEEIAIVSDLMNERAQFLQNKVGNQTSSGVAPVPGQVITDGNKRILVVKNEEFKLNRGDGNWFYPEPIGIPELSGQVKLHLSVTNSEDLIKLQSSVIPHLYQDAQLKSLFTTWKTLDPSNLNGVEPVGIVPNGVASGSKGFTIYAQNVQDLEKLAVRLDKIVEENQLALKSAVEGGNVDKPYGQTNRVTVVRDTWAKTENVNSQVGYKLDERLRSAIETEYARGTKLTQEQLRMVEQKAGLMPNTLTYDKDGKLMLVAKSSTNRNGMLYASETEAVSIFGQKTDRYALYALHDLHNVNAVNFNSGTNSAGASAVAKKVEEGFSSATNSPNPSATQTLVTNNNINTSAIDPNNQTNQSQLTSKKNTSSEVEYVSPQPELDETDFLPGEKNFFGDDFSTDYLYDDRDFQLSFEVPKTEGLKGIVENSGKETFEFLKPSAYEKQRKNISITDDDKEYRIISVRRYRDLKLKFELIIPEEYAQKLDILRELRLNAKSGKMLDKAKLKAFKMENALLPEEILHRVSMIPNENRISQIQLLGEQNLAKPSVAGEAYKTNMIRLYSKTTNKNVDSVFMHEWSHLAEKDNKFFDLYTSLVREEKVVDRVEERLNYVLENKDKVNEDWAVHLGERFLSTNKADFLEFVHTSPLRATILAKALEQELANGSTNHAIAHAMRERIRYVDKVIHEQLKDNFDRDFERLINNPGSQAWKSYAENSIVNLRKIAEKDSDLANKLLNAELMLDAAQHLNKPNVLESVDFLINKYVEVNPKSNHLIQSVQALDAVKLSDLRSKITAQSKNIERRELLKLSVKVRSESWLTDVSKSLNGLNQVDMFWLVAREIDSVPADMRLPLLRTLRQNVESSKDITALVDLKIKNSVPQAGPTKFRLKEYVNYGDIEGEIHLFDEINGKILIEKKNWIAPTGEVRTSFDATNARQIVINGQEHFVDSQNNVWRMSYGNVENHAHHITSFEFVEPSKLTSAKKLAPKNLKPVSEFHRIAESISKDISDFPAAREIDEVIFHTGFETRTLKHNDNNFIPFNPSKNDINVTKSDINCGPCTIALFKSLLTGKVHSFKEICHVVYTQEYTLEKLQTHFSNKNINLKTVQQQGNSYETIPEGHYAMTFSLGGDWSHMVYLRKYAGGEIAIYDPQGDYLYDAFGIDEIAKRKPSFKKIEAIGDEQLHELKISDENKFSVEQIREQAAVTRAIEYKKKGIAEVDQETSERAALIRKLRSFIAEDYRSALIDIKTSNDPDYKLFEIINFAFERLEKSVSPADFEQFSKLRMQLMMDNDAVKRQIEIMFVDHSDNDKVFFAK